MKAVRLFLTAIVLAVTVAGAGAARAQEAINTDMVIGFLMGYAQTNPTAAGSFLGGATSTALTGGMPTLGTTDINSILGSSGLSGNLLGNSFGGLLNGTPTYMPINGNLGAFDSMVTGYLAGQLTGQTGLNISSLGFGDAFMAPGLPGTGMTSNGISSVVSALIGHNATSNVIQNIVGGDFLAQAAEGSLLGVQGGAVIALMDQLNLNPGGTGLSLLGTLGLDSLTGGGLSALGTNGTGLLSALNMQGGLTGMLTGGSGTITDMMGGANLAALNTMLSGGNLIGQIGGMASGINATGLLGNAQALLNNGSALVNQVMQGDILGGAVSNALNNAIGTALGSSLNNVLGGGRGGYSGRHDRLELH